MAPAQVTERDCREGEEGDRVIANNTREQLEKLSAPSRSLRTSSA